MDRILFHCLDINLKSAFRNLESAILVGAMLFALCLSSRGAAGQENPADWICLSERQSQ